MTVFPLGHIVQSFDMSVYRESNVHISKIQYTIRNIPAPIDRIIKKRAKQSGKSFNQTVVDILALRIFGSTDIKEDDGFWLDI